MIQLPTMAIKYQSAAAQELTLLPTMAVKLQSMQVHLMTLLPLKKALKTLLLNTSLVKVKILSMASMILRPLR